jgi:hypothetical protein
MALTVAVGFATGAFAPLWGSASSHREAPIVAGDPEVDTTDVYAFVSPNKRGCGPHRPRRGGTVDGPFRDPRTSEVAKSPTERVQH